MGHEVGREGRAAQDGLPRPAHAVGARGDASRLVREAPTAIELASRSCRSTTPAAYAVFQDARHGRDLPVRVGRHARLPRKLKPDGVRRPDRDERALPPGPDGERISRTSSTASTASRRRATSIRRSSRSCKETYGVFVYQEQVMPAANVLAGFSLAQADELRRAMGKKKPRRWPARSGVRRGLREEQGPEQESREDLRRWRSSRATGSTAPTAPPTRCSPTSRAYLKAHYPAEFMAATLTSEVADTRPHRDADRGGRRMGSRSCRPT